MFILITYLMLIRMLGKINYPTQQKVINRIITTCKLKVSDFIDEQELYVRLLIYFYYFRGLSIYEVMKMLHISIKEVDLLQGKLLKKSAEWDESHLFI